MTLRTTGFAVVSGLLLVRTSAAQAPWFTGLRQYDPGYSETRVNALSEEGRVAVGGDTYLHPNFATATRWTLPENSEQPLGYFNSGNPAGFGKGISYDGSVIAGDAWTGTANHAFRWTSGSGMQDLGGLPGGDDDTATFGISGDGQVIVGDSSSANGREAFRWTAQGGMVGLGELPGGQFFSRARAATFDGSVVVGLSYVAGGRRAFQWSEASGMTALSNIPGGGESWASAVSADGSVIVGGYTDRPAIWRNGQAAVLPFPAGAQSAVATAVSADGNIIVGYEHDSVTGNLYPLIWFGNEVGVRLDTLLVTGCGLDLGGWYQLTPTALSPDGTVIAGQAPDPFGASLAWAAMIPAPQSVVIVVTGFAVYLGRRRRIRS